METEYRHIKTCDTSTSSWTPFFRQVLVSLLLWTAYINAGMGIGTPTVAIPQLRKEANSTAAVSNEMASWLTSILGFSGLISNIIVIPIAHFMGRKAIMIILSSSTLISSAIMYFSKTAIQLLISQIVLGLTFCSLGSVLLLILSEYSSPKYRGVFLTIKSATLFWGIWIANAIGIFTHYKYTGLVGFFCSSYSLIIAFIIPESPYWLAFRGRYDECAIAHRWLKGANEEAEKELDVLIKSQQVIVKNVDSARSLQKYLKTCLTDIKQPDIYKPLILSCLLCAMYNLSGKLVCAVYAIEMMKKFTENESTVYTGVLILDGFTVLGMYVGCGLSKILKRRTLLLSTSIAGTMFLFTMCIYLYLIKFSVLPENDYIIIAMLVGYSVAVCCGPMILSTTISAELLPLKCRNVCTFIYSVNTLIIWSSTIKITPYVFNSFGFQGAYLGFVICSTILITLAYKYVPETKDRTLLEIADIFLTKEQRGAAQIKLLPSSS